MDHLIEIFQHFTLSARVFFSGKLCGLSGDHDTKSSGHLHVLKSGSIEIIQPNKQLLTIDEPSVLFFPGPMQHRFQTSEEGVEIVCAHVDFGAGVMQPFIQSLPTFMHIPLASSDHLVRGVALLFEEAFASLPGRQTAVDRLAEYLLVLLLRDAVDRDLVHSGTLRGLSDARLSKSLIAIHQKPGELWDLEKLAAEAGMSRARFAAYFRELVGTTPMSYLTGWRMSMVQDMLRRGESLKSIAPLVGYESSSALSRTFTQSIGMSPTEWLDSIRL